MGHPGPKDAGEGARATKESAEIEPQTRDSRQQEQAERNVNAMFGGSFVRRLTLRRGYRDGVDLVLDGGKGESRQFPTFGNRSRQADGDEHHRAYCEHEDGVVKEVHVHDPAD